MCAQILGLPDPHGRGTVLTTYKIYNAVNVYKKQNFTYYS